MERRKKASVSILIAATVVLAIAIVISKHPRDILLGAALGMVIGITLVLRATYERVDPSKKQITEESSD